ncbi:MAG TPA: hypothetical protein VE964_08765 [Myxococcales bacterium]|nr:hypothetical protein [Myxococcales bacterium]
MVTFALFLMFKRQLLSTVLKICEQGHVMHDSWAKCPNCQATPNP